MSAIFWDNRSKNKYNFHDNIVVDRCDNTQYELLIRSVLDIENYIVPSDKNKFVMLSKKRMNVRDNLEDL